MRRVLLDSNALDPMLNTFGAYETLEAAVKSAKLEVLFTHVTVDEIAVTPDQDKRQWLLNLLVFLGRPVFTSGAVADFSRLNFCRVMADDDNTFDPLRSGSTKHSRDALIAHTALNEGCALITNEKRLAARARDQGVEVLTTAELLAEFGFVFPAPTSTE
jgi:rRNA-processing protein FCF1